MYMIFEAQGKPKKGTVESSDNVQHTQQDEIHKWYTNSVHFESDHEGFEDASNNPLGTPREKYLRSLLKGKRYAKAKITIKKVKGRGGLWQNLSSLEILSVIMVG